MRSKSSSGRTAERELLVVEGREITLSNPRKVLFPDAGYTKLDLVQYYLAVSDGALRALSRPDRPPKGREISRSASSKE